LTRVFWRAPFSSRLRPAGRDTDTEKHSLPAL
jgi:hypothetical protein